MDMALEATRLCRLRAARGHSIGEGNGKMRKLPRGIQYDDKAPLGLVGILAHSVQPEAPHSRRPQRRGA